MIGAVGLATDVEGGGTAGGGKVVEVAGIEVDIGCCAGSTWSELETGPGCMGGNLIGPMFWGG